MELPARQKSVVKCGATDELQNPSSYSTQKRTVHKQKRVPWISCLQQGLCSLILSLTNLFNLSIRAGFFLRDRKLAKVTPIYKDDKKCVPGNYRPIFVLPA